MNKILFIGTNHFAANVLKHIIKYKKSCINVITKPDSKIGRGKIITSHPVKKLAINYKLSPYTPISINNTSIIDLIIKLHPYILIIIEYGEILHKNLIQNKNFITINIHPSILPRFRGPTPIYNTILKGDKETGVSIIKINTKIDAGYILNINKCKVSNKTTYILLERKLQKIAFKCLMQTIYMLEKCKIKLKKQCEINATYTKKFKKNTYKINWDDKAININRKIRALSKKPYAHTIYKNKCIKIIEVTKNNIKNTLNIPPGTIKKISKTGLEIFTKTTMINIKKIQLENKKPITINDILNSNKKFFIPNNKFE